MTARRWRHADLILVAVTALVFLQWPQLDLQLARLFHVPGQGFTWDRAWWVQLIYVVVARFWVLAPVLAALLLLSLLPRLRQRWRRHRLVVAYLLAALLLGPGLVANTLLKNHWGRPRPVHLAEFGGPAHFTPALEPSRQCPRNCAFVSGHAAAAFYLMAPYWVTGRRRWLAAGIAFGLFVGAVRMVMGAHFLSDVLFAGFVVYFSCQCLASLMLRRRAAPRLSVMPAPHPGGVPD